MLLLRLDTTSPLVKKTVGHLLTSPDSKGS
jgi:hypothetical protein